MSPRSSPDALDPSGAGGRGAAERSWLADALRADIVQRSLREQ